MAVDQLSSRVATSQAAGLPLPTNTRRIDALDGVRAIAVLMVLAFHGPTLVLAEVSFCMLETPALVLKCYIAPR